MPELTVLSIPEFPRSLNEPMRAASVARLVVAAAMAQVANAESGQRPA